MAKSAGDELISEGTAQHDIHTHPAWRNARTATAIGEYLLYPNQQSAQPQYAPPVQPQYAPSGLPSFDQATDPTGGGGAQPRARNLVDRTVIYIPKRIDENATFEGQPRPSVLADLIVLDGGDLLYGDSAKRGDPRPATHRVATPALFTGVMIGEGQVVNALRPAVPPLGNGLVLGVIQQGTQGNLPWMLTRCEKTVTGQDRPDAAERRARARQVYDAYVAGAMQWPTPVPLTPPAAQVNYAPQAPQTTQSVQPQVNYAPQAPPAGSHPADIPAPAGWDLNVWAGFTIEQKRAIVGSAPMLVSGWPAPGSPQSAGI